MHNETERYRDTTYGLKVLERKLNLYYFVIVWLIENKQQWQRNLWETENLGDTNKIFEQIALAPPPPPPPEIDPLRLCIFK